MKKLLILTFLTFGLLNPCTTGIYVKNETYFNPHNEDNNPAYWTENALWGSILEEWTLSSNREGRVIQFYNPMQLSIKRTDNFIEIPLERVETTKPIGTKEKPFDKESKISSSALLHGPRPNLPPKIVNNNISAKPPMRQVTETDLYLLGAIEKLVYRVDFMEKRLRRIEEMTYFMMAGNRIDTVLCAANFTRVNHNCYFFGTNAGRELDWKAASKHCHKLGAALVELESIEENQDMITFIQSNAQLRGKDFWTSGLNPGLLWIWSGSARPVATTDPNKKLTTIIAGDGRCLRLAYDPQLRAYTYKGTECSARYPYICEKPDTTASNEINRIGRLRNVFIDDPREEL